MLINTYAQRVLREFFAEILNRKKDAERMGVTLDIVVLRSEFHETLMAAVSGMKEASDAFELRPSISHPDHKDVYLYGIKVMWSPDRLPPRGVWFRYSNNAPRREEKQ